MVIHVHRLVSGNNKNIQSKMVSIVYYIYFIFFSENPPTVESKLSIKVFYIAKH